MVAACKGHSNNLITTLSFCSMKLFFSQQWELKHWIRCVVLTLTLKNNLNQEVDIFILFRTSFFNGVLKKLQTWSWITSLQLCIQNTGTSWAYSTVTYKLWVWVYGLTVCCLKSMLFSNSCLGIAGRKIWLFLKWTVDTITLLIKMDKYKDLCQYFLNSEI